MVKKSDSAVDVAELQQQVIDKTEAYKRVLADYDNLLKRTQQERQQLRQSVTQEVITDLLPTVDHLSMALQHFSDGSLKMIFDELVKVLESYGLRRMEVLGRPFDAQTMEVVDTVPASREYSEHSVVQEALPGYFLQNQVLRHAKVVVAQGNNKEETWEK